MDCEKFSPNAREIFNEITKYYPPNPWNQPQWTEDGKVFDNGWHDLRKEFDRTWLITWYERLIGSTIVTLAGDRKNKGGKLTRDVFSIKLSKRWIELAVLLKELDFQIETLDLVE